MEPNTESPPNPSRIGRVCFSFLRARCPARRALDEMQALEKIASGIVLLAIRLRIL